MRPFERISAGSPCAAPWCGGVGCILALAGCIVRLDDEFADVDASAEEAGGAPSDASLPVLAGCLPFLDTHPSAGLSGALRSRPVADGGVLWVSDRASFADGSAGPAAFVAGMDSSEDCWAWQSDGLGPAFDPSPLAADGVLEPLDLVSGTAIGLYYALSVPDPTAPSQLRPVGIGLALLDPSRGRFTPTGELLWTADRPSYGSSALLVANQVYVFGCRSASLSASCYLARAPTDQIAVAAAYSYWDGATWSSNPDSAVAITQTAGATISVREDPSGVAGYLMTFVPPLGSTLVGEQAPAPEGPWSGPVTIAACDLDGDPAGTVCGGGQQHPELARGQLVVSYYALSLLSDGAAPRPSWPHLATVPLAAQLR